MLYVSLISFPYLSLDLFKVNTLKLKDFILFYIIKQLFPAEVEKAGEDEDDDEEEEEGEEGWGEADEGKEEEEEEGVEEAPAFKAARNMVSTFSLVLQETKKC